MSTLALTAAAVIVGICGCSVSTESGFGLPTLAAEARHLVLEASDRSPVPLDGDLRIEPSGCMTFDDGSRDEDTHAWIIWPDTAHQDGESVVLDSGSTLTQGDHIEGAGAYIDLGALPDAADSSSYFASFGRYCGAAARGVVLMTEVGP
ncbi:hypothetical protein IF188_05720 [Microbacterium sp. NEAU-LLC]|uniref:Uncharacterized protein n=1 Tax=Microbacterium helvum TaxID=2773713 RepID=A0ABR8NNU5_9MICO|nr:hypothetical protein [Microbacterium helvum]MBD3941196.1 hypothetical protein [Microbacterium helvum]